MRPAGRLVGVRVRAGRHGDRTCAFYAIDREPGVRAVNLTEFIKTYDIRGMVGSQVTPEVFRALGAAFAGVVMKPAGHVQMVLGYDMRPSSPDLAAAFAQGINGAGVDVVVIGLCASDQLYFASGALACPGAMVTASHNPAQYNGLKLCRGHAEPVGMDDGLRQIREVAQAALDAVAAIAAPVQAVTPATATTSPAPTGGQRSQDITQDYVDYLYSLVDVSGMRPLRVVVDAGNGMAGLSAPAVLQDGPAPLEMFGLFLELDGTFPNHEPNPLDEKNLVDLGRAVLEHSADLGLAFDGDADRCFVVDEAGRPISSSAISTLVALEEIAAEVARGIPAGEITVVHNSVTSLALPAAIEATGACPVMTKVGHVYVKQAMAAHQAIFGAEHSGHYYFRDFWYADTGMLMALRVLAALGSAAESPPLSALIGPFQAYSHSGEINFTVSDAAGATEQVLAWGVGEDPDIQVDHVDGLRMISRSAGDHFWAVSLRSSNTEPLLRLNVEADDEPGMVRVRDELHHVLSSAAGASPAKTGRSDASSGQGMGTVLR
ncbi:phosphomannomutase/phosphoglucomutase [soil metagenome]